jgi:hypothetical protein
LLTNRGIAVVSADKGLIAHAFNLRMLFKVMASGQKEFSEIFPGLLLSVLVLMRCKWLILVRFYKYPVLRAIHF